MDDKAVNLLWENYINTKDIEIKNELIINYLPLVKAIAHRVLYSLPSHINVNDLTSAGIFGLISSIEKFNPKLGNSFKSFASIRIHGAMLDELRNMDWVPRSVRSKAKQIQSAFSAVQQSKGRFALDSEVADFLGISLEDLGQMIDSSKIITLVSLDAKIYNSINNNYSKFSDFVKDKSEKLPIENLYFKERKELLIKAINELSKQEKIVLMLYYYEELTLREIGSVLNVTESRVSQIHSKAIYRLRARLSTSEVLDYASN